MLMRSFNRRSAPFALLGATAVFLMFVVTMANALPVVRHLHLLRSEPAKNSTVTTAPRELRLWFSQRPEVAMTSARIASGSHNSAAGRAVIRPWDGEGVLVVMPIRDSLANGRHVVVWRTMAQDGHVITGEFAFTVAVRGGRAGE